MTLIHRFGQSIGNPSAHADHRRPVDAEFYSDRIRRLESDAADVACESIRVLRHDLDGIGAVSLEDADRACGAHTMAMQEDHDLPHDLLLGPCPGDPLGTHRADAGHLAQTIGLGLDHIEHLFTKHLDHFLGVDRANASDHPGSEILFDAFGRRRRRGAHETGPELLAMGAVVDPLAGCGDPFAGGDDGSVSDDGHQFAVPARLDANDAEAVLGVVVSDALDEARQNFLGRWLRLCLRRTVHDLPSSVAVTNSSMEANRRAVRRRAFADPLAPSRSGSTF